MERLYAWQWHKLYPYHTLFGRPIWKLQFLQEGKSSKPWPWPTVSLSMANIDSQFAEPSPNADLSPMRRLVCGAAAGITSVTITYPLDIVRTRLSIQSASFAGLGQRETGDALPGMFRTMILIYRNEGGAIALYRGIVPTVAGVAPYVSLDIWRIIFRIQLTCAGRSQLHDLRVSPEISHTPRGEESQLLSQTVGRRYLRCSSANLHISIVRAHVSLIYFSVELTVAQ